MGKKIEGGYILMPRAWDKSEAAHWPPVTRELWFWLLRNASYSDNTNFSRGEYFFTIQQARDALSWLSGYRTESYSVAQIGRAIKRLSDEGAITTKKSTRGIRVMVVNYDAYQSPKNYEVGASPDYNEDLADADVPIDTAAETGGDVKVYKQIVYKTTDGNGRGHGGWDDRSNRHGEHKPSPKNAGNAAEMTAKVGDRLVGDEQKGEDAGTPATHYNNGTYGMARSEGEPDDPLRKTHGRINGRGTAVVTGETASFYNHNIYGHTESNGRSAGEARASSTRCTINNKGKKERSNNKKEETPKNNTSDILDAEPEPENTNATAAAVTSNLPRAFLDSPFRDESERFAAWFNRELKPQGIRGTQKELSDWALVWYHLRQTDNRDNVAEMGEAIRWARNDPFWSINFQTPNKLRKRDKNGMMYIDRFIALYKRQKNGITNGKTRKNGRLGDQMPVDAEGLREIAERIANNPRLSH